MCRYPRRRRGQKNEIRQTENIVGGARQTDALLGYVGFKEAGVDDICVVKGFKKECSKSIFQPLIFPLKACFRLKDSEQVTL